MTVPRYLVPVSQTPDAPFIVKPSRIFPWVGIGYPLLVGIVIPGLACLMTFLEGRLLGASTQFLTMTAVLPVVQLIALAWGVVHAARLALVRRRLATSLDGVIMPSPDVVNAVQLDDAALYRRDDRRPTVKKLVHWQSAILRLRDEPGVNDSFPAFPEELRRDFQNRQRPRRGLMSATFLLTVAWVGLTFLTFKFGRDYGVHSPYLVVIVALGVLLMATLLIIAAVRNSIDNALRTRILALRREVADRTARTM